MAKTSKVKKNEQRRAIVAKYAARRRELKAIIKNPTSTPEQRADAYAAIRKMPRTPQWCVFTTVAGCGRPRAFLRQFGLAVSLPRHVAGRIHSRRAEGKLVVTSQKCSPAAGRGFIRAADPQDR